MVNTNRSLMIAGLSAGLLASVFVAPAIAISSVKSGLWSDASTWTTGTVPTSTDTVYIVTGTTVTLDVMNAVSSTITVLGVLKASRVASSSLALAGGNITVQGILDYGTEADPIPAGITAQLVLAYGGAYGLIAKYGGQFTVRGSTKTPYAFATQSITTADTSLHVYGSTSVAGWQTGDVITIGPTTGNGPATTSSRTITGVTGGPDYTINWSGGPLDAARTLSPAGPIIVGDLTRNVLVRSSGTVIGTLAYMTSQPENRASFMLTEGEFAYINTPGPSHSINDPDLHWRICSMSSSTVRNGYGTGIYIPDDDIGETFHYCSLTGNNIYFNHGDGIVVDTPFCTLTGNNVYSNYNAGIDARMNTTLTGNNVYSNGAGFVLGSTNTLTGNNAFSNSCTGIFTGSDNRLTGNNVYYNAIGVSFQDSSDNFLVGNNVYYNTGDGISFTGRSRNNTLARNNSYSNAGDGISFDSSLSYSNTLIGNNSYSNSRYGIYYGNSSSNTFADGNIGYNAAGTSLPDTAAEIYFQPGFAESLTLKGTRVNPAGGVSTDGMNKAGACLLSYNQNADTGTVRIWGNYQLAGSTLTLDYSTQLYASTSTAPDLIWDYDWWYMMGWPHVITNVTTYDAFTLSELITLTVTAIDKTTSPYIDTWTVIGSSSGLLGSIDVQDSFSIHSYHPVPVSLTHPKVKITLKPGTNARLGDTLAFATIAASKDANKQKKLLFGPAASSFNNGRSKLEVASTGGLVLRGKADGTASTLVDWLSPASIYYTFVDSGAFTAEHALFTNMDPGGIQLSGTAGVAISSSTFDYLGFASGTNTYITARNLTSNATFYNVAFGLSRSSAGYDSAYNVRVEGSDAGLAWRFSGDPAMRGPLWGEAYDSELGSSNKVLWDDQCTAPVGLALGISSISWTWSALENASGYNVYYSTSPATELGSTASTSFVQEGLTPNTTYSIVAAALTTSGLSPLSEAGAPVYTLAKPPSGVASTIYLTSAAISWDLNGNPASTRADIVRSTDNAAFGGVFDGMATAYTDTGLLGCTSYYYRLRNLNGGNIATAYNALTLFINGPAPAYTPGNLSAVSLAGNRISLSWEPSPAADTAGYRLYFDGGTGTINYNTPIATFTATETGYTTGVLVSSGAYKFGLRAINRCGLEEKNTSVVASAAALASLAGVRTAIKIPQTGKRINGNRVTVMAEPVLGEISQIKQVLFQYKPSMVAVWRNIPPADGNHPNPDTDSPYLVHWDVTALSPANYDIRAVATDLRNNADPAPPAITVTITFADSDINENSQGGGTIKKDQQVNNAVENTIEAADEGTAQVTRLELPASALNASTVTVSVTNNPVSVPPPPAGADAAGVTTEVTLSNAQTVLSNGQTAAVTLSYADANNDGIVDGTTLRAETLQMYSSESVGGPWNKDLASSVDLSNKTVTGHTSHFSFFALFAVLAGDLNTVAVYPVPFKPNGGNADAGVPYSAGDVNSGIIFDNLPASVKIRIYTVTGQLVAKFGSMASSGKLQWDVKNEDGRDVASGGYIAVISSPGMKSVIKKIVVVR